VEKTLTPPRAASHPAGTPVTSPEVTLSPARPVRCSSLTTRHLRVTQPVTLPRSARPPCKSAQGRMCQTLSPDPAPLHEWTVSRHGRTGTCAHLCQVSPGATHSPPQCLGTPLAPRPQGPTVQHRQGTSHPGGRARGAGHSAVPEKSWSPGLLTQPGQSQTSGMSVCLSSKAVGGPSLSAQRQEANNAGREAGVGGHRVPQTALASLAEWPVSAHCPGAAGPAGDTPCPRVTSPYRPVGTDMAVPARSQDWTSQSPGLKGEAKPGTDSPPCTIKGGPQGKPSGGAGTSIGALRGE
jgi:hypothetical protein